MRFFWLIPFVLLASSARSQDVLSQKDVVSGKIESGEIVVSQDSEKPWKVGDSACISGNEKRVRCGKVISATREFATVRLTLKAKGAELLPATPDRPKRKVKRNVAKVKPVPSPVPVPPPPTPSPTPTPTPTPVPPPTVSPPPVPEKPRARKPQSVESVSQILAKKEYPFLVSLGLDAGVNYAFGMMQLQYAFSRRLVGGLGVLYTNNFGVTSRESGIGGSATLGLFLNNRRNFEGFYLETGARLYSLALERGGTSDSSLRWGIPLSFNWKAQVTRYDLFIGLGLGLQYVFEGAPNRIIFYGLLPLFRVSLGITF